MLMSFNIFQLFTGYLGFFPPVNSLFTCFGHFSVYLSLFCRIFDNSANFLSGLYDTNTFLQLWLALL